MNRNRTAGHNWERYCLNVLKVIPYFKNLVTSRSESKRRDDRGIDLMNQDEADNGRIIFDIQCKTTCNSINYNKLIKELGTDRVPLVLHRKTEKKGKVFRKEDDYAILRFDDFLEILKRVNDFNLKNNISQ